MTKGRMEFGTAEQRNGGVRLVRDCNVYEVEERGDVPGESDQNEHENTECSGDVKASQVGTCEPARGKATGSEVMCVDTRSGEEGGGEYSHTPSLRLRNQTQ
jgi:hypothetical protein